MKALISLNLILLLTLTGWAQTGPETTVAGTWEGSSICTVANSPCHDEHVVYHIKADSKDASKFSIDANKIVNGKEENMGALSCVYTAAKKELYCDTPGEWRFTVSADKMVGTLHLHGTLYRNVELTKK
jgi:hypothetical protein